MKQPDSKYYLTAKKFWDTVVNTDPKKVIPELDKKGKPIKPH